MISLPCDHEISTSVRKDICSLSVGMPQSRRHRRTPQKEEDQWIFPLLLIDRRERKFSEGGRLQTVESLVEYYFATHFLLL